MEVVRPQSKQPIPNHATCVFTGKIFEIYQWEQPMFDGSTVTFEKARRVSDSVNVIPITKEGNIVLVQQEQPQELPFIGVPGGRMDSGESPSETAIRELVEETGYQAESLELLVSGHPDIKVDWVIYTFIAKGLTKVADIEADPGEKIELLEVSFTEYMDIILKPNYRDSELTLYFLKAQKDPEQYDKLKEKFGPS